MSEPKRFAAIEGLRGWLAWTVVLCHIAYAADIYARGWGEVLKGAGSTAVMVFMIVSGFVITHLLIERQETYGTYIFRRFMRIFPLFAVTCVTGYFCVPLLVEASTRVPWQDAQTFKVLSDIVHSQTVHFWPNFLAHVTMMHGVISDDVLPRSQYAFNSPAWSLSLEWQYYLVAPLALVLARRPSTTLIAIGVMTALCIAYDFGAFGNFEQRSLLFASAPLFAVGIASRMAYQKLAGSLRNPATVLALLVAQTPLGWNVAPFIVWGSVYAIIITDRRNLQPLDAAIVKLASRMLESWPALLMGERSYSIYLCHISLIGLAFYTLTSSSVSLSKTETFLALIAAVVPATIAVSWLLYLAIEKPGIALGKALSGRKIFAAASA